MSEQAGEKTEQATPKRLEEALRKGQFARSPEVQTAFVLAAGLIALRMSGSEIWGRLALAFTGIFEQLHDISLAQENMQGYLVKGILFLAVCAAPVAMTTIVAGLLAGAVQSRFNTASEALEPNWERVNPMAGLKKMFSMQSLVTTGLSILKLTVIGAVCWSGVKNILQDPIFFTAIDPAQIARFLSQTAGSIGTRVLLVLVR